MEGVVCLGEGERRELSPLYAVINRFRVEIHYKIYSPPIFLSVFIKLIHQSIHENQLIFLINLIFFQFFKPKILI